MCSEKTEYCPTTDTTKLLLSNELKDIHKLLIANGTNFYPTENATAFFACIRVVSNNRIFWMNAVSNPT
jgi:hypothetical protein